MSSTKIKEKDKEKGKGKEKDEVEKKSHEIIAYEHAMKRYNDELKALHDAALKKALYEEGLNTAKISRKDMDEIKRIRDKQGPIRQKYQDRMNKAQQEAQAKIVAAQSEGQEIINKLNAEYQEELGANQKAMNDIIDALRKEQGVTKPEEPGEDKNEEGDGDKNKEESVEEGTDKRETEK